jgi:hypothetical protein
LGTALIDTEAVDRLYEIALGGLDLAADYDVPVVDEAVNARQAILDQLQRTIETPSMDQVANVGLPLLAAHAALGASIGSSARTLSAKPGDVVMVWTPPLTNSGKPEDEREARKSLAETLNFALELVGIKNVLILTLPAGMEVETLDEDQMGSLGWSRA